MMSTALVRTPTSQPTGSATAISPSFYPPSPGTWRHPKFTEIVSRQAASTFSDRNLKRAAWNAIALFLSFFFNSPIHTAFNQTSTALTIPNPTTTTFYTLNIVRLYLLVNFAYALLPLFPDFFPSLKPKDQITDIPLTPSQRSLLGLDPSIPSSLLDTPTSGDGKSPFITPPRYRRLSGSSFSGSSPFNASSTERRSISATYYSSSPLSASRNFSPSPALSPFGSPNRGGNGSPFSPAASPLLHKAVGSKANNNHRDLADGERRRSFGNSVSGLGRSQSLRERGARAVSDKDKEPDTPSPTGGLAGARRNPHLNYKWLYEKGARLPQSETMLF